MCGQCALPVTGYVCPMGCPKELRNGPCGGVGADGGCEVYPQMRCVWVEAYERAASQGQAADLRLLHLPIDHRRWGESSWLNYWQGRDEGLWTGEAGDTGGNAPRPSPPACPGGFMSLRDRLTSGSFAVTAEISPPRGASTDPITATAALLRDWVNAVNVTDNQGSNVRLASWAGSLAALQAGLEPVMQMTCRDRNRIALQSDLLGASALGIRNVLVMTGDHPKFGDHPEAKPVFDLDSVQLLWTLRHMRDQGAVLSGRALKPPPDCFLGAVENPFAPPAGFRAERLGKKIDAGAQFVQTQFVFDVAAFARWMAQVRDLGLHQKCYILAGVGAVRSRNALDFMRDKVPGVNVPDDVYRRLRAVPADQTAAEGARLAAETIQQLRAIDGVAGVHLLVAGNEQAVPGILDEAPASGR